MLVHFHKKGGDLIYKEAIVIEYDLSRLIMLIPVTLTFQKSLDITRLQLEILFLCEYLKRVSTASNRLEPV